MFDEHIQNWANKIDDILAQHADALERGIVDELRTALAVLVDPPNPLAQEFRASDGSCRLCNDSGMVNIIRTYASEREFPVQRFICLCPTGQVIRLAQGGRKPTTASMLFPDISPRTTTVEAILVLVDMVLIHFREGIDPVAWATLRLDLSLALEGRQNVVWMEFLALNNRCGLCGNSGMIRMHNFNSPCICPNGRVLRRRCELPTYPPDILAPGHARWNEFVARLALACNVDSVGNDVIWECDNDWRRATTILLDMGVDLAGTILVCTEHGANCDCEILVNIPPTTSHSPHI